MVGDHHSRRRGGGSGFLYFEEAEGEPEGQLEEKNEPSVAAGAGAYPGNEQIAEVPAEEQTVCDGEDPSACSAGNLKGADQPGTVRAGLYADRGDHHGI